jgi:hypothetical protein
MILLSDMSIYAIIAMLLILAVILVIAAISLAKNDKQFFDEVMKDEKKIAHWDDKK